MPLSARLEPAVEACLEQEARCLGISKSEFVKDSLERCLGMKNPAELLKGVRSGAPSGNPKLSANVSAKVKRKLRAKHSH